MRKMLKTALERAALKRRLAVLHGSNSESAIKEIIAIRKRLEWLESNNLLTTAYRLGLELDMNASWFNIPKKGRANDPIPTYFRLTNDGEIIDLDPPVETSESSGLRPIPINYQTRLKLKRLIREERFRRAEQWTKLLSALIAGLTGLLGVIIGLLALLLRR